MDTTDALPFGGLPFCGKLPSKDNSSKKSQAVMPVERDAMEYNMRHPHRGKAVIFNHKTFEMDRLEDREGTELDKIQLQKTFEILGFDASSILCHDDLTYDEIQDSIRSLSKEDYSESDCLIIVVLSHGLDNLILACEGVGYPAYKLWTPFLPNNCPTLAGKPKIFLIQACQGEKTDSGTALFSQPRSPRLGRSLGGHRTDSLGSSSSLSYTIPSMADFLIATSSVSGYLSWRGIEDGSWFIQAICKIFNEHSKDKDLLSMMTLVAKEVAIKCESDSPNEPKMHLKKQVPHVMYTLIRDVYFHDKAS